jgi:ATP-dependent RNA helicase RhlE
LAKLPIKKQTLFFSATMPKEIATLANSILVNPVKIEVAPVSSTADTVKQKMFFTTKNDKKALLVHLLANPEILNVLVFTRTKH